MALPKDCMQKCSAFRHTIMQRTDKDKAENYPGGQWRQLRASGFSKENFKRAVLAATRQEEAVCVSTLSCSRFSLCNLILLRAEKVIDRSYKGCYNKACL